MKAKRMLVGMLSTAVLAAVAVQSLCSIPELIHLRQGQNASYSFFLPVKMQVQEDSVCVSEVTHNSLGATQTTLIPVKTGETQVKLRLLGCIPVGSSTVQVHQERILMPGGQSIGLALTTEGVFIVDTADVFLKDGSAVQPAKTAGLEAGDSILRVNDTAVHSLEELTQAVAASGGKPMEITYRREGKDLTTTVTPVADESDIARIGVWVRDSTAGIGTMTYIDPETMTFGALGHAVTDQDSGRILPIEEGQVYQSQIMEVKKGERGEAGELHGVFTENWDSVHSLNRNTEYGVYGRMDAVETNPLYPNGLPLAAQAEVQPGPASILTTVDDTGIREFSCEILRVTPQLTPDTRSMVIRITDPELLSITGGIVQGMSGSPIIQDGKLVGAVTHVLVNDPTRGYGIFIENMLDAAG